MTPVDLVLYTKQHPMFWTKVQVTLFIVQIAVAEIYRRRAKRITNETWRRIAATQRLLDEAHKVPPSESFTCPRCGAVSYNEMDRIERYCSACHTFPEDRERASK